MATRQTSASSWKGSVSICIVGRVRGRNRSYLLRLAALVVLDVELDCAPAVIALRDLRTQHELHALLPERLLDVLADLGVHARPTDLI